MRTRRKGVSCSLRRYPELDPIFGGGRAHREGRVDEERAH